MIANWTTCVLSPKDNCIYFQSEIEVWLHGELQDKGLVQDYTEVLLKINGF